MAGYRIKRGTQEFPVSDLDSLVKLARDGRLVPEDPVLVGEEWVRADSLPALRPHLGADPWSIWENAERLDAEAVYRAALAAGEQVADLTDEQMRPLMVLDAKVPEGGEVAPEVAPQVASPPPPAAAVAPTAGQTTAPAPAMSWNPPPPAEPRPQEKKVEERRPELSLVAGGQPHSDRRKPPLEKPRTERTAEGTEVIRLPRPRELPELARPERRPPSGLRPLRLLTWLFVGLIVAMLGWVSYQLGKPPRLNPEDGILPRSELPAPPTPSPVQLLEKELRAALPPNPRAVVEAGDLPDNLTIELQQMGVDVVTVEATVTKWAGRKEDQPQAAEIHITIKPSEALERDMGAIGLVVGRYVTLYRLSVPVFEVIVITDDQAVKRNFDAVRSSSFYEERLSLEGWLE
jgi:hypothetical protein